MAKKRSNKSIANLVDKLKAQDTLISNYARENDKLSKEGANVRLDKLESNLISLTNILVSMTDVNKVLVSRLSKTMGTEDDKVSTISTTTVRPVKKGDSTADVLAKIYTFFVKTKEDDKRKGEIDKDFAQKKINESKRKKTTVSSATQKVDKPSSNPILSLLGMVYGGVKGLVGFITGGLVGIIGGGLGMLKDTIIGGLYNIPVIGTLMRIGESGIKGLLGLFKVVGGILRIVTDLSMGIGRIVARIVFKVITSSSGLIFKVISPLLANLLKMTFKGTKGFAGMLDVAGEAMGLGSLGTAGATIATIAGAMGIGEFLESKERSVRYGPEWADLDKRQKQLEDDYENKIIPLRKKSGGDPRALVAAEEMNQRRIHELNQIPKLKEEAINRYVDSTVTPAFEEAGYEKVIQDRDGPVLGFQNKSNHGEFIKYAALGDTKDDLFTLDPERVTKIVGSYNAKKALAEAPKQSADYLYDEFSKTDVGKSVISKSDDFGDRISELNKQMESVTPTTQPTSTPVSRFIPPIMDNDMVESSEPIVINQPTRSTTNTSEEQTGGSASIRNPNSTIYRTINYEFMKLAP